MGALFIPINPQTPRCAPWPGDAAGALPSVPDFRRAVRSLTGKLESAAAVRSGDRTIGLIGWQTQLFVDLVGAELFVSGRPTTAAGDTIAIEDFEILRVDGLPTLDGLLVRTLDQYFLYVRTGVRPVLDVPEGLVKFVGHRVWVAGNGTHTARFGLLERPF